MKRLKTTPGFAFFLMLCGFISCQALAEDNAGSAGKSIYGKDHYVEYIIGNLPVIISVPHGGRLTPKVIPDRSSGVLLADGNTDLLAKQIVHAFYWQTGK